MMAFKPPPELRSRVEIIKKKFEVIKQSNGIVNADNIQVSSAENVDNIQSYVNKNEPRNENANIFLSANTETLEIQNHVKKRLEKVKSSSSSSGKGNIRRSPAFRCEKMPLSQQPTHGIKMHSVVNNRVKMFETNQPNKKNIAPVDNFRKDDVLCDVSLERPNVYHCEDPAVRHNTSKFTPANSQDILLHHKAEKNGVVNQLNSNLCSNSSYLRTEDLIKSPLISRRHTTLPQSSENIENSNILYKDMSSKIRREKGMLNGDSSGKLSNTLRAALQAPLPPGPPPKKPPRTFVHGSPDISIRKESLLSSSGTEDKTNVKNAADKSDLNSHKTSDKKPVEPHLMLEKLESVLLKHQHGIGSVVLKPRPQPSEVKCGNEGKTLEKDVAIKNTSVPSVHLSPLQSLSQEQRKELKTHDNRLGGCFESLNCVSNAHLYEKLVEKQSEFFVDSLVDSCEEKTQENNHELLVLQNVGSSKVLTKEHVYVEPYACIDVDSILRAELFEPNKRDLKEKRDVYDKYVDKIVEPPSSLHYMCSPINALDRIDALLKSSNANTLKTNTNESNSKIVSLDSTKSTDSDVRQNKYEDKMLAQKSFLHFSSLSKQQNNPASLTSHKLDKSKVQLFINQAFGSPLHDLPVTPLDSLSSDESIPTTPDEMNPPSVSNCEGSECQRRKEREEDEVSTPESESSVENMFDKHKEMSKLTEERKVYVRRVSSRVFSTRQRLPSKPFTHLYHCIMLIGLNLDGEKKTKIPYIKSKYPPNAPLPPLIEHLCFPDAADWPLVNNLGDKTDERSYSLVITNETGDHMFGYCRRVMPEGTDICLPLAYCIVSPVRAKGFYFKILAELESQHGQPEWCQKAFIKELYACEFPNPGQSLKLSNTIKDVPGSVEKLLTSLSSQLRRPLDSRLEEHDLTLLFSTLTIPTLIQVFASLLLERKVLFICNSLSKLSSCIEALHSILYPFSWQYTFIPVLPSAHIGVCEAPTPFVIGLLKDKKGKIPSISLEEGIVVDLEQSKILQSVGDESTILPPRLKKCLKMALHLVETTTEESEPARNVLISEAFIRMFVEMCGHYSNHIVMQQDGKKVFERESFIKSVPSQHVQLFLEWFTETAMFSIFVESRLEEGTDNKGLFEQRALEHSEEMNKNTMLFHRNYKAINKKVKSLGDRLKDWTTFT